MAEPNKQPVDVVSEEVRVELPVPPATPKPDEVVTTNRETPIVRHLEAPLSETHGMTTEAERFKEN